MIEYFLSNNWMFWFAVLIGIIFLFWLFFGGKEQEFVGFNPYLHLVESESMEVCQPGEVTSIDVFTVYDQSDPPSIVPNSNPSRWKRQEECCRKAEEIFGKPFRRDIRDLPWLINPETGANLELDCYNAELGIAIEHNGEHHYKYPNRWNKTRDEWVKMVKRDQLKPELCDQNGVYLITIPYSVPFSEIKDEIRHQLKDLVEDNPSFKLK